MQAEGASVFFTGAAQWLVSPAGRRDTWGPLQSLSGDRLVTLLGPLPRRAARAAGKKDLAGHRERRRQAGKARPLRSVLAAVWAGCRRQLVFQDLSRRAVN